MWYGGGSPEEIPVVPSFDAVARRTMESLDEGLMNELRKHVDRINNTNIMLFVSFMIPLVSPAFAIYYLYYRAKWEDLRSQPDLRLIEGAFQNADPDELKSMKRVSKRVVTLGRFFDARDTYKWLILGNLGIVLFYGLCICGGVLVGVASAM